MMRVLGSIQEVQTKPFGKCVPHRTRVRIIDYVRTFVPAFDVCQVSMLHHHSKWRGRVTKEIRRGCSSLQTTQNTQEPSPNEASPNSMHRYTHRLEFEKKHCCFGSRLTRLTNANASKANQIGRRTCSSFFW